MGELRINNERPFISPQLGNKIKGSLIYTKAKELQWQRADKFKKLIFQMGGFHIATNFLSVIGNRYSESGFEDTLIETDQMYSKSQHCSPLP